MNLSNFHSKYFAHDLTRQGGKGLDRLSMSLFDAAVDLNPHQIEAALFALESPLSKGVILADEVGLGKTIEAGIVLCQLWAERKRKLIVICPASLRKQWSMELEEKFSLPTRVLDAKQYRQAMSSGKSPFSEKKIIIMSYHYANRIREDIKTIDWNLVVIDEAHKLRNAYRPSNRMGQGIRWATENCRKLLLTATPLQNSLLEIYGLSTLIDEHIFGDVTAFRSQYTSATANLNELKQRINGFCKRTLRNQVNEYIRYTERRTITQPFSPNDEEQHLYDSVSRFLQRDLSYALPERQRHLMALILRKLLASSSYAIAGTLDTLRIRLENVRDEIHQEEDELVQQLVEGEELEDELLDEILSEDEDDADLDNESPQIDRKILQEEIDTLRELGTLARSIVVDTKTESLCQALKLGFEQMSASGAAEKAIVFTESRRTQDYLKDYLEDNGYAGKIVVFNGSNTSPESKAIYDSWVEQNTESGLATGSRAVDMRTALINHFKDEATILIATEAAAEGINLQFCSLVINYDLPWNPQRIEQRIGRCHRYGQKHDVVVINFLNERNHADRRVLELLDQKFNLFNGIFGASDDVLGSIESGLDFEQRVLSIYQDCRTPEAIDAAFKALQEEMEDSIRSRLDETQKTLFDHFDEDVHQKLRIQLQDARSQLDRVGQRFWSLTQKVIKDDATFNDETLTFDLHSSPKEEVVAGRYYLISKSKPITESNNNEHEMQNHGSYLYRLSHPLGEHVIEKAKALETQDSSLTFDISNHETRIHVIEDMKGSSGYLRLSRLLVDSYEQEEYLLFSGFYEDGQAIDHETFEKLFSCMCKSTTGIQIPEIIQDRLNAESHRHIQATINRSLEENSVHFNAAREKLESWADDMVLSAEKALKDTKQQIKNLRRESRQATTLEEQHGIQEQISKLERRQRKQRKEIFEAEDQIMDKRDQLIDSLEKRLTQQTESETLFTVQWSVE